MLACLRQRPMLLGAVPFGHQQLGLINRVDVVSSHLVCGTTDARSLGNHPNEGRALSQVGLRSSSLPVANFVARAVAPPGSSPVFDMCSLNVWGWPVAEDVEF